MADPNVLVWTALDLPLRDLYYCYVWDLPPLYVAADHSGQTLVRVPGSSQLGNFEQRSVNACASVADAV